MFMLEELNPKMKEQMEKMKAGEINPEMKEQIEKVKAGEEPVKKKGKKKGEKQLKAESFLAKVGLQSTVLAENR